MRSLWALALVGAALGLTPAAPIQDDEPPLADVRLTGRLQAHPSRPLVHGRFDWELTVWQWTRRFDRIVFDEPIWLCVAHGEFGEQGEFELEGVFPGEATFRVAVTGYQPLELQLDGLAPGGSLDLGDVALVPGRTLRGRVLLPDCTPARAFVRIDDPSTPAHPSSFGRLPREDAIHFNPDREGRFEVRCLGEGPFTLMATVGNLSGVDWTLRVDGLMPGDEERDFVLQPALQLTGHLHDHLGAPVGSEEESRIIARLVDVPSLSGYATVLGTGPEYCLKGLGRGRWEVEYRGATVVIDVVDEDVVLDLHAAPDWDGR